MLKNVCSSSVISGLLAVGCVFSVLPTAFGDLAESVGRLPAEGAGPQAFAGDWLVEAVPHKTAVARSEDGREIVVSNGLLSRRWRIEPGAACIAFDNLMTGASVIRGIKPEAIVSLNGQEIPVGGLLGQPNYAYLKPEWVDGLRTDPGAFQLIGFEAGPITEAFAWKQVRYAGNTTWPPPGKHLRFDYQLPQSYFDRRSEDAAKPSSYGRKALLVDDFAKLDPAWKVHESRASDRSSFSNEGKIGEIMTPANTCVFVERALPAETGIVECYVHTGTDTAASWGPGMTLLWPDRTVKFYLRPQEDSGSFSVTDNGHEYLLNKPFDTSKGHFLRARLTPGRVFFETSITGESWGEVYSLALSETSGPPQTVRIGKTGKYGNDRDHGDAGTMGRSRVGRFRVYGGFDSSLLAEKVARSPLRDVVVSVHYEMLDSLPVMSKWITVTNNAATPVNLDSFKNEILAIVEPESGVETRMAWNGFDYPPIYIEGDYAFGGFTPRMINKTTHWKNDPQYHTQVNYLKNTPCLIECHPPFGPDQTLEPGAVFESYRSNELVFDSTERERRGLAQRRMYRAICPWVTENPIMMHVRYADPATVKRAIDQCVEVGFEMVIMTFGSGFNIENESPDYIEQIKALCDYADSQGIELGGYSLLASRRINPPGDNAINPETGQPGGGTFGYAPALASDWGQNYFRKLYAFFEKTGLDLLEHDGSYPGDPDAVARPPLQKGYKDSVWVQWRIITDFYRWCRGRGIYLNVPDWYYLNGSNKHGMGYRETNWSLPREQQLIHGRQNIYDGSWYKTPSMGWMFVPLTQYHGGGAAATLEPLEQHLDDYERHMANNFGAGVQACYRGPRLYDTPRTRAMVKRWVDLYKKHRAILDSDIIHLRRADGRDIDYFLHANPFIEEKGFLMIYNPLDEVVEKTLTVPLYYTGLQGTARISEQDGPAKKVALDARQQVRLEVSVPARGYTWYVIR